MAYCSSIMHIENSGIRMVRWDEPITRKPRHTGVLRTLSRRDVRMTDERRTILTSYSEWTVLSALRSKASIMSFHPTVPLAGGIAACWTSNAIPVPSHLLRAGHGSGG